MCSISNSGRTRKNTTKIICVRGKTKKRSIVFVAKQMCLLQALEAASEGRTVVKIAHRLNTIANADIIAVLHAGKVVEIGKPEQLLADPEGFFYNLFHNQKQQPSE